MSLLSHWAPQCHVWMRIWGQTGAGWLMRWSNACSGKRDLVVVYGRKMGSEREGR